MSFIGPPVINFENTQQHTHVISYQMNTPRTNMCRTVYKCSLRLVARAKPAHRFLLRVTHFVRDEMTSSTIHTTRSKIQIPDSTHSRIQDLASIFWRRSQIWGSRDRSDLIFRVWSEVWNLDSRFGILTIGNWRMNMHAYVRSEYSLEACKNKAIKPSLDDYHRHSINRDIQVIDW